MASFRQVFLAISFVSWFVLPRAGVAQQTASKPAAEAFAEVFTEWKELLKQLRDLQARFAIAEDSELNEIRAEFEAGVKKGKSLVPKLRETGLKAYQETPNTDRELTRFLITLGEDDLNQDNFVAAYELFKTLLDNECGDKRLFDLAGKAAFAIHEFDTAKQYLKEAESHDLLDKGEDYLPYVDEVKAAWEVEQAIREKEAQDDDLPRVKIETNKGDVVVELFENEAPDTVGNFVSLVEKGFYDGLVFHRVLPSFMAQTGCPEGTGNGGPGYNIYCECHQENHRKHFRGSLSMAKSPARDTGGSQFYLTFMPTPHLNGEHTVFGRVLEGFEVLEQLQRRDPDSPEAASITPDRIVKAEVIRKRDHEYLPNKVK